MINYVIQLIIDEYIEVLSTPPKKPGFLGGGGIPERNPVFVFNIQNDMPQPPPEFPLLKWEPLR
jgi:hypothetical protein